MCKTAEPSQLESVCSVFFFLWVIEASCVSMDAAHVQSVSDPASQITHAHPAKIKGFAELQAFLAERHVHIAGRQ